MPYLNCYLVHELVIRSISLFWIIYCGKMHVTKFLCIPFYVYNSVELSTFTFYNHHHDPSPELLSSTKTGLIKQLPTLPLRQPLASTILPFSL